MNRKRILCLDFDGVIHSYVSGWQGADVIPDPPVPGAVSAISAYTNDFEVHVFSSRSNQPGGIDAMRAWFAKFFPAGIVAQLKFPTEKPPAHVTIDDRGLTFMGEWPTVAELAGFLPWNKRRDGLGPTGRFPEGKLTDDDEGGLRMAMTHKDGKVILDFGKPVAWIGLGPGDARLLAAGLLRRAEEANRG